LSGSPDAPANPSGNGTGTGTPSTDLLGSGLATTKRVLAASLSEAGKPVLTRGGKAVSTLSAGSYRLTIIDRDPKRGFTLRSQGGGAAKRLTSDAFVGKHLVTVALAAGKWTYGTGALTRTFLVTR
jgi:hypothetical protein